MKKISVVTILLAGLFVAGCQESSTKSSSINESSCHTCFTLDKTQQEVTQKKIREGVYHFATEDTQIYSADGSKVIGNVIKGYGLAEVKEEGDKVILKVSGYIKEGDNLNIYADENFILPAITLTDGNIAEDMEVSLPKKKLTKAENEVWSKSEFIYYDNCSMCHAAHSPKQHTIQEWEGVYGTMKAFAMPTKEDDKLIWEYLRSHSKGSFALDD